MARNTVRPIASTRKNTPGGAGVVSRGGVADLVGTQASNLQDAARDLGEQAERHAGPWVERLARLGYFAKGVLYVLVGLLAVKAAIGWGQASGSKDALATLAGDNWYSTLLLWFVAFGLAGYAIWQFFRAALDPEHEGNDRKGIATRVFFVISGLIYGLLGVWVFTHLLTSAGGGGSGGSGGGGGGGGGEGTQGLVGRALEWGVAGRLAVAIAAACIIGYGVQQLIKAWRVDLSDQLELSRMSQGMRRATIHIGRAGMAARGVVLAMIGWFCLMAAWRSSQGEAGGLGEALTTLGGFGPWVLGAIAIGLVAYGLYQLILSRYRRIDTR